MTSQEAYATEIEARAARRIVELSKALEGNPGAGGHNDRVALPSTGTSLKTAALKAAGVPRSAAYRFGAIAELPEEDFEGYVTEVEAAALGLRHEHRAPHRPGFGLLSKPKRWKIAYTSAYT